MRAKVIHYWLVAIVSYADSHNPDSLAAALARLLADETHRYQLIQQGPHLASRYTWDNAYEQYAVLFKELLSS